MRYLSFAILLLVATAVSAAESTPPDQTGWVPQFVQCPEDTVVIDRRLPRGIAYIAAVNPNSGKPSSHIRYHLVEGDGTVDSISGRWSIKTSNFPNGYIGRVEISASFGKRGTSGSENCHFVFRMELSNRPPSIVPTGFGCGGPRFTCCLPPLDQKYCSTFTYDFDACDSEGDPYWFELVAGPGDISSSTGVWSWDGATLADVGDSVLLQVRATDANHGPTVSLWIHVTNAAPAIITYVGCPVDGGKIATHVTRTLQFAATDDCNIINWLVVDDHDSATSVSIDQSGLLTFSATVPGAYTVNVIASDGLLADTCAALFTVSDESNISVSIEKTNFTLQGQFEYVDVTLDSATLPLGGFNFLVSYDNTAISLQEVLKGTIYTECGWEYFTYRFGAGGNCGTGCPSGLVRVVGLAEINNGTLHPSCYGAAGQTLFTLKFFVGNDRDLECQFVPIRFFWLACEDNALADKTGGLLYIANRVFEAWDRTHPLPASDSFPSYSGVPVGYCLNPVVGKPQPIRDIDFYNGGVDIVCADSIDARGDINLNGIQYEIADFVLFSRYFIYGVGVFTFNQAGQIAASDVNSDNLTLRIEDLVCLSRAAVTGSTTYGPNSANPATFTLDNGTISVTTVDTLGAIYFRLQGNVLPQLLAANMNMMYNYDGINTSVLVLPLIQHLDTPDVIYAGPVLSVGNTSILEASTATYLGGKITSHVDMPSDASFSHDSNLPATFALQQNYPNPFNASTVISFGLPKASDVTLEVFNIVGQIVYVHQGRYSAGTHSIAWNGTDADGEAVASGLYYYRITAGEFTSTRKMLLLK